jgi:hypothetical protein
VAQGKEGAQVKIKLAAVAGAVLLALTACGEPAPKSDQAQTDPRYSGSDYLEVSVKLKDGRTVLCLTGTYRLNCDWEHAK